MKILKTLTPKAYTISKKVFDGQLTFKEGKKKLVGNRKMNPNSAADYINNFRCMVEGRRFTRTNNAFSIEYFFENIYKDYGLLKLSNALTALKLHIEYYEGIQKVKMHKMRDIYNRYFPAVPIDTPDEAEQNEIINEIKKQRETRQDILKELKKLKTTDSEQITISSKSFKRDNRTIAQIKILRDFKCQICSESIKKKDGSMYIEAAHIKPKHQKGRETPDNIILLCPNHHKEFDFGNLKVQKHNTQHIEFLLNETLHNISLKLE